MISTPFTGGPAAGSESIRLPDGGWIRLRPVRSSDKAAFLRAFDRLSSQSRYRRFLAYKRALTDADLRFLTEVDGDSHYALVAEALEAMNGDGEVVGAARYIRQDGAPETAEIAVTVVDTHQRRGIGTRLLERLLEVAYRAGIRRVQVHLLAENLPVRKLLENLLGMHELERDAGIISGELPLRAPVEPKTREAREPLFELLRLAAEEAVLPVNLTLMFSRRQLKALKRKLDSATGGHDAKNS